MFGFTCTQCHYDGVNTLAWFPGKSHNLGEKASNCSDKQEMKIGLLIPQTSVCEMHILLTVQMINFTLGMYILSGPGKCSVEFCAIWTHDTLNMNKDWINRQPAPCGQCGLCAFSLWIELNMSSFTFSDKLLQQRVKIYSKIMFILFISPCQTVTDIHGYSGCWSPSWQQHS